MRYFAIDDLSREERVVVKNYLKRNAQPAAIDNMFWLPLPEELLEELQKEHVECGPYFFGIELQDDFVNFELLVRSQTNLHCNCIGYATDSQRQFLMQFIDRLIEEEQLKA